MSRVIHATTRDYSHGTSSVRDYVANALQILHGVIADLRDQEGEPFLLGRQDDLNGIRLRLERALTILDTWGPA